MRRRVIGVFLILHGLAHAAAGVWASTMGNLWLSTGLWAVAMVAFLAAGFGLLGVPRLGAWWRALTLHGAVASLLLLALYRHPALGVGIVIDLALVFMAFRLPVPPPPHLASTRRLRLAASHTGHALAWVALIYVATIVVTRPWYTTWGTTRAERAAPIPHDQWGDSAHFRIDHAVTIAAPAEAVWPCLAQIGQDRGGFYSHDKLERLIGDDIRNADRVVPEWQHRQVGEFVPATQPGYLRGIFGSQPGWMIAAIEPNRYLVLENWGAFVLEPVDSTTTRLIARTRGDAHPTMSTVVLAPLGLLVFEPAHFIMQRAMLLGIRDRAERSASVALRTEGGR